MADLVCGPCIVEHCLVDLISTKGKRGQCTYCERSNRKVMLISDVADHIRECLFQDYAYAEEVLPYSQGEYFGVTCETYELLEKLDLECEDSVLQDLVQEIDEGQLWTARDINGTPGEVLSDGWREFESVVKHKTRFFLSSVTGIPDLNPSSPGPFEALELAAALIEKHDLFVALGQGSELFRVREARDDEPAPKQPHEFGPLSPERSIQSNRMNPPGISALYASCDEATSLAEVPGRAGYERYVCALSIMTDVKLVDLTKIPPPPALLCLDRSNERPGLQFLDTFSDMCSRSIDRDDRVHVEYVPTQVACEFLMLRFKDKGVKGIKFPSAKRRRGQNVVLFDGPECMAPSDEGRLWSHKRPYLKLTRHYHVSSAALQFCEEGSQQAV